MTGQFNFNFSGDDIGEDDDAETSTSHTPVAEVAGPTPELVEARSVSLESLISTVPSRIQFQLLEVPISRNLASQEKFILARREIFDMRAQLMAEDNLDDESPARNSFHIFCLEHGDIEPGIYEGGFKTWECATDLLRYLIERVAPVLFGPGPLLPREDVHIIELGAGTAMPAISLLARILFQSLCHPCTSASPRKIHFTICDYNGPVLALATVPNILLLLRVFQKTVRKVLSDRNYRYLNDSSTWPIEFELWKDELSRKETSDVLAQELGRRNITISFISGAWSPKFVDLARGGSRHLSPVRKTLVLASETIYSPSSLPAFTDTLQSLLQVPSPDPTPSVSTQAPETSIPPAEPPTRPTKTRASAMALVAAKRIYFGVGGDVEEFKEVAREKGMTVEEKWVTDAGNTESEAGERAGERAGVERVVMEVRAA